MSRPITFRVGSHDIVIEERRQGRWSVVVDGRLHDGTFATAAEAWQAGVGEADRLDELIRELAKCPPGRQR